VKPHLQCRGRIGSGQAAESTISSHDTRQVLSLPTNVTLSCLLLGSRPEVG
jgi:hypothetical protein